MSPDKSSVVIVGAGAVGVNVALFLARSGLEVVLMDPADCILDGAPRASFINHGDGFEYYKPGHHRTGEYCIDGAITKALLYPIQAFATRVCDPAYPIRFLVSKASISCGDVTLARFYDNAEQMRSHFARQWGAIRSVRGWSDDVLEYHLIRTPASFARCLQESEFADIAGVSGGYAGSGFGINMPHYYAFMAAALRQVNVGCETNTEPSLIERIPGGYCVHTNTRSVFASNVVFAAGHHNPMLTRRIRGVRVSQPMPGTYYLNAMTFLRLPATSNGETLERVRRINFTLQQEHGAMYACIVAPSASRQGLAAVYYPSLRGSQLRRHIFDPDAPSLLPQEWDDLIENGLSNEDPAVLKTFEQVCRTYPFLSDYAEVSHTICRPLFNIATPDSEQGTDRRVREIPKGGMTIVEDGSITTWAAPKWTNAELVAVMAADHVLRHAGMNPLPARGHSQFGPLGLDIARISEEFAFKNVRMRVSDAHWYAQTSRLPDVIVDETIDQFEHTT